MENKEKKFTVFAIVNTHGYTNRPDLYHYHISWIRNSNLEDRYTKYESAIKSRRFSDVPGYLRNFEHCDYIRFKILSKNVPKEKLHKFIIKCNNIIKKKYGESQIYTTESR